MGNKKHNKYEFILKDYLGGIKRKETCYNLLLDNFWNKNWQHSNRAWGTVYLGSGTGVVSPMDKTLFSPLWSQNTTVTSFTYPDDNNGIITLQATFPANASYVGTITEVGVSNNGGMGTPASNNQVLATHAMLEDAEGNPITIEKTALDTLIVTMTIYISRQRVEDPGIKNISAEKNLLMRYWTEGVNGDANVGNAIKPPVLYSQITRRYVSRNSSGQKNIDAAFHNQIATSGAIQNPSQINRNREFPCAVARTDISSGNFGFANWIFAESYGIKPLQITPYQLQKKRVGVGDGSKTEFVCPIPNFMQNTQEVTINNVVQDPSTYTIDHMGNSALHPSSRSCLSYFSIVDIIENANRVGSRSWFTYGSGKRPIPGDPTVYEFDSPVSIDTIYFPGITLFGQSGAATFKHLYLEWSSDGVTWNLAYDVSEPNTTYNVTTSASWIPASSIMTFSPILAQYWRLSVDEANNIWGLVNNGAGATPISDNWFGHIGHGLVFNTAPANGDIIEISANVEQPWKDDGYVIDFSATLRI